MQICAWLDIISNSLFPFSFSENDIILRQMMVHGNGLKNSEIHKFGDIMHREKGI